MLPLEENCIGPAKISLGQLQRQDIGRTSTRCFFRCSRRRQVQLAHSTCTRAFPMGRRGGAVAPHDARARLRAARRRENDLAVTAKTTLIAILFACRNYILLAPDLQPRRQTTEATCGRHLSSHPPGKRTQALLPQFEAVGTKRGGQSQSRTIHMDEDVPGPRVTTACDSLLPAGPEGWASGNDSGVDL